MDRQCYRFANFRIDTQTRVLWRDDERVTIPPKTADLLLTLLERGPDIVSRDELMKLVWPDTIVEDNNLAKHIFVLRQTLGSDDKGGAYIETVPKRGYRFAGEVERHASSEVPVISREDYEREQIIIERNAPNQLDPAGIT